MFREALPYYLSLGMTAAQFWEDDPWLAAAYRRADELERQRRSDEMWMQGWYVFNAASTAIQNAFRKKGARPQKYLEEPVRVIPYTEEEKAAREEEERQKTIEYFAKMANQWKKEHQSQVP